MRLFAGITLLGIVAAAPALATSSMALGEAPAKTLSFVTLDPAGQAANMDSGSTSQVSEPAATPSIQARIHPSKAGTSTIAVGAPPPAVSGEEVAAIGDAASPIFRQIPMVIRGGIFGDMAPAPEAAPQEATAQPKLSRPQQRKLERDYRRAVREGRVPADPAAQPPQDTAAAEPQASNTPAPAQPSQTIK